MTAERESTVTIVCAVTAAYTIGVLGGNMQPLLIGALIDGLHMDEGNAGLWGSIELGAVAATSFILAPRVASIPRRLCVAVGAGLVALGYIASALPQSFGALVPWRVVAGAGAGMVLSIGNATVSACRQPDRIFAQMTIAGTVIITLLLALLPLPIARFAYRGGYVGMGGITLLLLPLLWWIPDTVPRGADHADLETGNAGLGLATLAAAALLFFSQSGMWAFSERLAGRAHLTPQQTGLALSGSTLAGLCGAALATWIGTRTGRTGPLTAGILVTGLSLLALVYAETPRAFTLVLTVNGIAYLFMVPYVMGTAAALDHQGRWAAATVGAATIGAALGPGIAGPVAQAGGYLTLGWVAFIATLASAAAVAPVGLALDRRTAGRLAIS